MTTTHLFVELLVIGMGALAWVTLAALGFFGTSWLPPIENWLFATFPVLAFAYVLGIVSDRLADKLLDGQAARLRNTTYKTEVEFFEARRLLKMQAPALWQDAEYARSRLRICRGWVLNCLLLAVVSPLALYRLAGPHACAMVMSTIAWLVLAGLCWFCWRSMTAVSFEKINRQAKWVREQGGSVGQDQR